MTFSHSLLSSARQEQAATNQQLPNDPWLRSVVEIPSTTSLGLSHISCWTKKGEKGKELQGEGEREGWMEKGGRRKVERE